MEQPKIGLEGKTVDELGLMLDVAKNNLAQVKFDLSQLDARAAADTKRKTLELASIPVNLAKNKDSKNTQVDTVTKNIEAISAAITALTA